MNMPFNMIYQAAYDREDEIRKDSSKEFNTEEQVKQTGRFAAMIHAITHRPERTRTYNTACATEQPAK